MAEAKVTKQSGQPLGGRPLLVGARALSVITIIWKRLITIPGIRSQRDISPGKPTTAAGFQSTGTARCVRCSTRSLTSCWPGRLKAAPP
jgi:hypothetical protein